VPVYGDGRNVRDWLWVTDHCRAIDRVLAMGRPGETYNVGGGAEFENIALVELLCDLVDTALREDNGLCARFPNCPVAGGRSSKSLIRFVQDRPGHDRRYAIDGGKISRELGFVPCVEPVDGLSATVRWYLDNEPWWRAVMDGSYRFWVAQQYGLAD
jgi:dTDP-glucose 4,6-dehydratase